MFHKMTRERTFGVALSIMSSLFLLLTSYQNCGGPLTALSSSGHVNDHLISISEACKFLDISDATLRRYIKSGKVPAYCFGKEYKFKLAELSRFVDASRVEVKAL